MNKEESDLFWKVDYPKMNWDAKIKHWSGGLHQHMRWNGESGVDEMEVFSKEGYDFWKEVEPNIDLMLPHILKILNLSLEKVKERFKQ